MPYKVVNDAPNCNGFAVVKIGETNAINGGCHQSESDAVAHMDALNIATIDEQRAVDLTPTAYMIDNCKRGLEYHQQGKSGDGLKPQTVRDANNIADGQPLSIDKLTRMRAWIARHMVDLDNAPKPNDKEYPSPGQVAHLLWASGTNREQAQKTFDWCDQKMSQIENENKRAASDPKTPAPPKDQIEGSDTNKPGSADNKTGGIELSEEVEKSLSNKVTKHNDEMKEKNKPDWTRVTLGALRAVYRRGAGAFSGSHRPGMTRGQWALGRVNAFLYLAKNGKPENEKYVGDNDLLNKDHPKYAESKKRKIIMENETRQLPPSYRPSASEDVPVVRPSCMNCESSCAVVDPTQMVTITMCERWNAEIVLDQYCDAWYPKEESEHEMESEMESESLMGSEPGDIESMMEYDSQPTSTWVTRSVDDKRSLAFTNVECRAIGDGNTLVGYASMFDAPSHDLGGFTEYVARGAFTKTLKDGADVRLLIDHEGAPLARTKSNTMRLVEDERGLRVEADLDPSNPRAAEIISALKRGDMNQMSFAFRVIRDEWSKDRATRTLKEVRLFDVSVVTFPAYEATIAEIRNASIVDNDDPVVSKLNLRKRQVQIATILK